MTLQKIRRVAFVGTGIMGAHIVRQLMKAGFEVVVYNRTREKAEELVAEGATWAESPAAATAEADAVCTMVGYPTDVEDVYLASDGILRAARKGTWLIDLTTSSPELARELHEAAEVLDLHAIDCPVTGGEQGAREGTLTLMVGCTEKDAQPILPLLESFSQKRFFFDKPGGGQAAKLCNQVSLVSCMMGYADALALAEQAGLDPDRVLEVMANGTGGSGASRTLAPLSREGDYRPGFLVEHLRKDIGLALAYSEELDVTLPGAVTSYTLLDMLCQIGGARLGTQALTLLYQDEAAGAAAGLDWSLLDRAGDEDDESDCGCGYDHHHGHDHSSEEGHACCGGHGGEGCCGAHQHEDERPSHEQED